MASYAVADRDVHAVGAPVADPEDLLGVGRHQQVDLVGREPVVRELLATTALLASQHLPLYAILCLPILFTAGMSLMDTIDGIFMNFA